MDGREESVYVREKREGELGLGAHVQERREERVCIWEKGEKGST